MTKRISFLGQMGSYSDLACRAAAPECLTVSCPSFEETIAAVHTGHADLAMLPVENSVAGRVADVHHLLPGSDLTIIGEHYQPVVHHLLALPGAKIEDIKTVQSHSQALAQCRGWLQAHGIRPLARMDTAGAAAELNTLKDPTVGAVASALAGQLYGLADLACDIADKKNNTTRFLILAPQAELPAYEDGKTYMTTLIFKVRSVPAALYKALGGFATNKVNITKLESYLVDGRFTAAQFYIDVEGHPQQKSLQLALEELDFFASEVLHLGTYPAHAFRKTN